jgi:hypothetical protein
MSFTDFFYGAMPGARPMSGDFPPIVDRLPSEEVFSAWQAPTHINELLDRIYPAGALETWIQFFTGEKIEDAEIEKIRAALKAHAQKPRDSGYLDDEILLRARQEIERGLQASAWLDLATESDHWKMIRDSASGIAQAVSERAALLMQKKSVDYLFEMRGDEIRAERQRANDLHLLYLLAEAIVMPRRHTGFPHEFFHLLPEDTASSIKFHREFEAGLARHKREEEEKRRREEAAIAERELAERLSAIEEADFDALLDLLFANRDSSILESFRHREKLTQAQLDALILLKDTSDPVKRRGYERLVQLASSVGIGVLTIEEIEELQAARSREEEEAREREIATTLRRIEESGWIELSAEAAARGLVPQEWLPWLHRVTDVERVYQVRDYFAAGAGRETDPVNKRICELLSSRAVSRNQGMAGAVGLRG